MATPKVRAYKQDLPPKGGYAPVNFKRIPARQIVNAPILFGTFAVTQVVGIYYYKKGVQKLQRDETEERSARIALEPLLAAERDRELLRTARRMRDAEEDLMKDVEGWEVGTWFGHKIFKTVDNPFLYMRKHYYYNHCRDMGRELESLADHFVTS